MDERILHIARYAGPRVYKQVLCQQDAGWDVTLMAGMTGLAELHKLVRKTIGWQTPEAMVDLGHYYTIVVHTTIATQADAHILPQYLPDDSPCIVWDCHDFVVGQPYAEFDSIVTPSQGMAQHFEQGATVIYSKVPTSLLPPPNKHRLPACCLMATIGNGLPWANYEGVSKRVCERTDGCATHIYPSDNKYEGHEQEVVLAQLPYRRMLQAMSTYEYGYAGAANPSVAIHDCVTNKFWEYLACGCQPLVYNSDEMETLASEHLLSDRAPVMEDELQKMATAYHLRY